jgi:hypothetical protein
MVFLMVLRHFINTCGIFSPFAPNSFSHKSSCSASNYFFQGCIPKLIHMYKNVTPAIWVLKFFSCFTSSEVKKFGSNWMIPNIPHIWSGQRKILLKITYICCELWTVVVFKNMSWKRD